jgi:hypothetical protein
LINFNAFSGGQAFDDDIAAALGGPHFDPIDVITVDGWLAEPNGAANY